MQIEIFIGKAGMQPPKTNLGKKKKGPEISPFVAHQMKKKNLTQGRANSKNHILMNLDYQTA